MWASPARRVKANIALEAEDATDGDSAHPSSWWWGGNSDISCDSTTTLASSSSTQDDVFSRPSSPAREWPSLLVESIGFPIEEAEKSVEQCERLRDQYKTAVVTAATAAFVRSNIYSEIFYSNVKRADTDAPIWIPWDSNAPFDRTSCLVWKRTRATVGTGVTGYQHKLGPISLSKELVSRDDLLYLKQKFGYSVRPIIHLVNVVYWMQLLARHGRYDPQDCHPGFLPTEDNLKAARRPRCKARDCINPAHFVQE